MAKKVKFQRHTLLQRSTSYRHSRSENGQGLIEYTLILTLFSLITLVGLNAMGVNLSKTFQKISDSLGLSNSPEEQLIEEKTGLQVQVVDPDNQGVPGVQVFVYQNGMTYNDLSGTTDSNGEIYFELETGTYSFMAFYQLKFFTSGAYTVPDDTLAVVQVSPNDFPVKVVTERWLRYSGYCGPGFSRGWHLYRYANRYRLFRRGQFLHARRKL